MARQINVTILGAGEVAKAVGEIAQEQPRILRSALAQEITNIKRSIAATVRNNKISKVKFDPNARKGKGSWKGEPLARRDEITRLLHGPKGGGVLGKDDSVDVASFKELGVSIGYKGTMSQYIRRWQDGIPNPVLGDMERAVGRVLYGMMRRRGEITGYPFGSREEHDAFYRRLYMDPPKLHASPPRRFMDKMAEISKRDFVPGLLSLIQKKIDGKIKTLDRKYTGRKFTSWAGWHA